MFISALQIWCVWIVVTVCKTFTTPSVRLFISDYEIKIIWVNIVSFDLNSTNNTSLYTPWEHHGYTWFQGVLTDTNVMKWINTCLASNKICDKVFKNGPIEIF